MGITSTEHPSDPFDSLSCFPYADLYFIVAPDDAALLLSPCGIEVRCNESSNWLSEWKFGRGLFRLAVESQQCLDSC